MIEVTQSKFSDAQTGQCGNCFQACIASILELPIDEVIDTGILAERAEKEGDNSLFWNSIEDWLNERGFQLRMITNPEVLTQHPEVYYIMSGVSPRNPAIYHSVVGNLGKMVWDPHPSGDGILPPYADSIVIEKLNDELNTEYVNDR